MTENCTALIPVPKEKLNEVLAQYPNPVATLEKVSDERERHVVVYRDRDTQRIIGVVEFNAYAEEVDQTA